MQPLETPKVSVIIPAFNAQQTIARTLESVSAQTHRNIEVIVVDDGSTDQTAGIIADFASRDHRINVLTQPNSGVAQARNLGLQHARGPFVAPIDADDVWHPTKIERQIERIVGRPKVGLVSVWSRKIDEQDIIVGSQLPLAVSGDVYVLMLLVNFIGTSSSPLIRREALEVVGGYDPGLRAAGAEGCEDWKMQLLLAERCDFEVVPQYLVGYRRLPTRMSANFWAMWRSRELVREEVRRRHPDLPKFLFRWLRANSARTRGMQFLKQSDLTAALRCFARAAVLDPFGTSRAMAKSGLRASSWMRTFALRGQPDGFEMSHGPHAGATDTVLGRPFLSVDTRITNVLDVKASSAWSVARIERARRIQRPSPPRESLRKTAWSAAGNRPDLDCTAKSASSGS